MMKKSGLKYRLVRRRIVKALLKNQRKVNFPVLDSIKTIFVLADKEFQKEFFIDQFRSIDKFEAVIYKAESRPKDDASAVIYASDLNFWGIPTKKHIEELVNQPFDVLINISKEQFDALDYISAKSKAKFKIGLYNSYSVYDLIIDQKDRNTEAFLKEILKTINNFS